MEYELWVIDDEPAVFYSLEKALQKYKVKIFDNPVKALSQMDCSKKYLFIIDYKMPGLTGLDFLIEVKKRNILYKAILLTAYAEKNILSHAINRNLISKIVEKPYVTADLEKMILELVVEKESGLEAIKEEIAQLKRENELINHIIGLDSGLVEIYKQIRYVARLNVPVMLTGETGTGKEVIADLIHEISSRKQYPIIKINCTAIQESLFESELFGYEKGAFTGADKMKQGKIELAHKGTLFLDEIGEMKPDLQARLLRVIETKKFSRLGGNNELNVDFRLITATNINLEQAVKEKRFRADLYYRIAKLPVMLPPLRERKEDIIQFINVLETRIASELSTPGKSFSEDAINLLVNHHWSGNIRELENIIYQAVILSVHEKEIPGRIINRIMQQKDDEEYKRGIKYFAREIDSDRLDFKKIRKDIINALMTELNYDIKKVAECTSLSVQSIYRIIGNS